MTGLTWDMLLFAWGFLAGFGAALAGLAITRARNEARQQGERLVAKLGPVDARRFLEVLGD